MALVPLPPAGLALAFWALVASMVSMLPSPGADAPETPVRTSPGANAPETPVRTSLRGRAWLQKASTVRWRNRVIDRMTDAGIQFTGPCKVDA